MARPRIFEMPDKMRQILVRLPAEMYDSLKELAAEQDRPITAEIRRAVRAHLGDAA